MRCVTASHVHRTIDAVWRIESARLIAGLARIVRDIGLAEDLAVEDRLNDEVREILGKYNEEISRGDINYQEMFRKIKAKLAREGNIIL